MDEKLDPFRYTSGPRDAQIIVVGEAWGDEEARQKIPFVGHSGKELDRMLFEAGIRRSEVLCTNLVDARPNSANDFASGFLKPNSRAGTRDPTFRGISCGPEVIEGHRKLCALIQQVGPRLVIGCGNWPLWALTTHASVRSAKSKLDQRSYKIPGGITSWRGSQTYVDHSCADTGLSGLGRDMSGYRVPYLPILHPAAILRDWRLRNITVHDLRARAYRFQIGETSWEPEKRYQVDDGSFEATTEWLRQLELKLDKTDEGVWIAVDVETHGRSRLACVGLAAEVLSGKPEAACVPFFKFAPGGASEDVYTLDQEVEISENLRRILSHPRARITNQNIIYDYQYIRRYMGISLRPAFDTMVAHHLLWPGTPKDLSTLSSLYCDHHLHWKEESEEWDIRVGHRDLWSYNCKDVLATLEITHVLREVVASQGMAALLVDRMEQWDLAREMMDRGVNYDTKLRADYQSKLLALGQETSDWLLSAMPDDLQFSSGGSPWYQSPLLQQEIFYDKLGIAPVIHKKTKRPTLDASSFEIIRKRAPWLAPLIDRLNLQRSISVFNSHFLNVRTLPSGRFGAGYNIAGTETFRWSSSSNAFDEGGNFQNIPKIEEE